MPYNTRRKSLSLPSLGIHVPSSKSSAARTSPNNNSTGANSTMSPKRTSAASPALSAASGNQVHPAKKLKRSHSGDASTASAMAPPSKPLKPTSPAVRFEPTPPPSPGLQYSIEMDDAGPSDSAEMKKIDLEGINDDIVEAVIVRLQHTRNRPHLVKELANVLMASVKIVQLSANPCAIISSRLSTYLKRSCWSALAPCPLAKELETVHPRRTYFYLTVCPHQPLPDASALKALVTPSLSSSVSTSEDADIDRRRELSLSPEIDLSSPEFDDAEDDMTVPATPMGAMSISSSHRPVPALSRTHRGDEPPLEKDEKEFTQTADGLQKRKASGDLLSAAPAINMDLDYGMHNEQLFGSDSKGINLIPGVLAQTHFLASPAMRPSFPLPPKSNEAESWAKLDAMLDWDRSPETVELDELDGLLNDY